jgi:hypothetical protein
MSGMLVDTTTTAHVAKTCVTVGERPKKAPIFVTNVADTTVIVAWLRAFCLSDLKAQIKAESLIVVPSTANGFRASVIALRSLDRKEGVSFHTFSLPEERCVRLLVNNL